MDTSARESALMATISWRDFGPFLQRLRRRRGLSQEMLADSLGCHRTYIWRLEHGRNHPSRIFLRSLELACTLMAEEAALLGVFKQLRVYGMNDLERD